MGTVEAIEKSIFGRVQEIKARFLSSVCGEETKKSEMGLLGLSSSVDSMKEVMKR